MCWRMQTLAQGECSLLRNMHTALFTQSTDNRLLTHRFVPINCDWTLIYQYSQLSRHLVALWTAKNEAATRLFERMMVKGTNTLCALESFFLACRTACLS